MLNFKQFGDTLFNDKIKRQLTVSNCSIIHGQKRAGKSSLSCMAAQYYTRLGYNCFSNYPVFNCYTMPIQTKIDKKTGREIYVVNKDWLYTTDFSDSVLFFDEGANIWPARGFATDWTYRDTEFFTMNSHHNTILMINVQYLDLLDINVRRACDYNFFVTRNRYFMNLTNVAVSEYVSLPVANLQAAIMSKSNRRAYPVSYQLCELPVGDYHFWRKPYYGLFDTHFDFRKYNKLDFEREELWQNLVDFGIPDVVYN